MKNEKYRIREICGDWALDIPFPGSIVTIFFNSRANAELVKKILIHEDAHPNEAVPFKQDHFPVVTKMIPLTLEQLRGMDGQPVWVEDLEKPERSGWRLIYWDRGKYMVLLSKSVEGYISEEYGKTWLAYAYHPAHIDQEAWKPCAKCIGCGNCYYFLYDDDEYPCNKCLKGSTDKNPYPEFNPIGFCKHCGRPLTEEAWAELEKRLRG